jgi:hypothetical protein
MNHNNTNIILVFIIILLLLIAMKDNMQVNKFVSKFVNKYKGNKSLIDNFVVLDNANANTNNITYDYLLTNGTLFYLYNSRAFEKEGENPKVFETLDEAEAFRKKTNTPPMEVTNIYIKKNIDDPVENYERECAKEISPFNSKMNTCFAYSKNIETLNKNKTLLDDMNASDHQLEACQLKKVLEDNPDLTPDNYSEKEIKYMNQFF